MSATAALPFSLLNVLDVSTQQSLPTVPSPPFRLRSSSFTNSSPTTLSSTLPIRKVKSSTQLHASKEAKTHTRPSKYVLLTVNSVSIIEFNSVMPIFLLHLIVLQGLIVEKNLSLFSPAERELCYLLLSLDQGHLFFDWRLPGENEFNDAMKHELLKELMEFNQIYMGGLQSYISKGRLLLDAAASGGGVNPYEGYQIVETPLDCITRVTSPFDISYYEEIGITEGVPHVGFVLVAGGLGERLGFPGIKLALPTEISTETTYLEHYCQSILQLQRKARLSTNNPALLLPLAIMTSDDTHSATLELLSLHSNFGLCPDQLILVKQDRVPAFLNASAHLATQVINKFSLDRKPHGNGDIHKLLHKQKIIEQWISKFGVRHVIFFQDTNVLVFRGVLAGLGVSIKKRLHVNSLTVPRMPGDALGAICKLRRLEGVDPSTLSPYVQSFPPVLTCSVEYMHIAGLLGQGVAEPLVPGTNESVFPGNINVIILEASSYLKELNRTSGLISEFINPKYKADQKTFKSTARLECTMEDWTKIIDPFYRNGYTHLPRHTSFSPVKNDIASGVSKQSQGNAPEVAATGESDFYMWNYSLLQHLGANLSPITTQNYSGITVSSPPRLVFSPSVGVTRNEIASKFLNSSNLIIRNSNQSTTLILEGEGIYIKQLDLDGTLIIKSRQDVIVIVENLNIKNKGWETVPIKEDLTSEDKYQVRGYYLNKLEEDEYYFDKAGIYILSDATKFLYKLNKLN